MSIPATSRRSRSSSAAISPYASSVSCTAPSGPRRTVSGPRVRWAMLRRCSSRSCCQASCSTSSVTSSAGTSPSG
ncbi:hypothetical protein ACFQ1I_21445 [Kitasatospora arboriphila]